MKKFFKSVNRLTPQFIALLMVFSAGIGHFITGTISLFEFWALLGLSQIILVVSAFINNVESLFEEAEESNKENTQINS
jgi:hypothetical protein